MIKRWQKQRDLERKAEEAISAMTNSWTVKTNSEQRGFLAFIALSMSGVLSASYTTPMPVEIRGILWLLWIFVLYVTWANWWVTSEGSEREWHDYR